MAIGIDFTKSLLPSACKPYFIDNLQAELIEIELSLN